MGGKWWSVEVGWGRLGGVAMKSNLSSMVSSSRGRNGWYVGKCHSNGWISELTTREQRGRGSIAVHYIAVIAPEWETLAV